MDGLILIQGRLAYRGLPQIRPKKHDYEVTHNVIIT